MPYFIILFVFLTSLHSEEYATNFTRHVHPIDQSSILPRVNIPFRPFENHIPTTNIISLKMPQSYHRNFSSQDLQAPISIETLLRSPERFHKQTVTVRGIVTQPEMHIDRTELFFDFVFVLKEGEQSLVVFGRHDRTQGSSPIAMGQTVEVTGIFWKDRIAQDYHFTNNLEAITVSPYPSMVPDRT